MHGDAQVPLVAATAAAPVQAPSPAPRPARKPGRPATYTFNKPDHELSEKERKLKVAIEKRRARQNRSYHRRKNRKNAASAASNAASASAAAAVPGPATWGVPVPQPMASVSASPTLSAPNAPRLVPGFAQNPLEMLADAGGSLGPVPGVATHRSLGMHIRSTSASAVAPDQVSVRPVPFKDASMVDVAPSSSGGMALLPEVDEVDATLDLGSTATSLEMADFSFGLGRPKVEEDEDVATEVLVNSALVAAKEYAKDSTNLKDVVDRENELRRMTGIKQIVFDNLRSKYLSMSPAMQDALRHFIIFPRTFNLGAAVSVAGLGQSQLVVMQGMIDSMVQTNFLHTAKGRYELNEAARLFLNEDPTVMKDNLAGGTYDVAQSRFINHYRTQLSQLQDDNIHKVGWLREHAMALYDSERENMEFSEFLLNGRQMELREFLSAGITVMRYCVSAANRERVLRKALLDDETSTENIFMSFGREDSNMTSMGIDSSSSTDDNGKSSGTCDKAHRARLQLALSEAYFDQLKTGEAEKPLLQALKLMGDVAPKCATTPSSGIVDSVLVLLLLSNLRLSSNRIRDARVLCVKALKILAEAGLGRSTFGINAMSNLVAIYLEEGHLEKAKSVAGRLLDTLNTMRYTGMPIYADALGVCAMVSMTENKFAEAERQYGTALETVGKWGSKQWTGIPVQHCLDLDLWLMEGLAEAIRRQGRIKEAVVLEQRAAEDRENRRLPRNCGSSAGGEFLDMDQQESSQSLGVVDNLPKLRHLY